MIVSGALAGLGGAFLAIVVAGIYREGQTGGRGFIGLAAMIFGNWRPGGLAAGAACSATPTRCSCAAATRRCTRCCSLARGRLLVAFAVWQLVRRRVRRGR